MTAIMQSGRTAGRAVLRTEDFSLTSEQEQLAESFGRFLADRSGLDVVRAAEGFDPPGFHERLWSDARKMGVLSMAIPTNRGGEGGGVVELALVAEQIGRQLAPIPLVESCVTARLLAATPGPRSERWLEQVLTGDRNVSLMLCPPSSGHPQLVPAGALADAVVCWTDPEIVLIESSGRRRAPTNLACAPVAWWGLGDGRSVSLSRGPLLEEVFRRAVAEYKVLTASALVGVGESALGMATDYAKARRAFGVPIGAFQAVSHRLVDAAIAVTSARRLARKAAWFADHEPLAREELVPMAFCHAAEAASLACSVAVHVHGGIGVAMEADPQLYFRRAKGWALLCGDPHREMAAVGRLVARCSSSSGNGI